MSWAEQRCTGDLRYLRCLLWGGIESQNHRIGLSSKRTVRTLTLRRLVAAISQSSGRNLGTTLCFGTKTKWNLCFQLHLSLLLFQQTIKDKLKEDWGKRCHETVLHWPRGSWEPHRSLPPVFSAVFMQEDSWHLTLWNTTPPPHTFYMALLEGGMWTKGFLKVRQVEHHHTKEDKLLVRYFFSRSHPHFIWVCFHRATELNSANTSVLQELDGIF